jgi:hypothetical protein
MRILSQRLEDAGFSVIDSVADRVPRLDRNLRELIQQADVVAINGEGSLHSGKPIVKAIMAIARFCREHHKPIFLINSMWWDNHEFDKDFRLFTSAYLRDKDSWAQVQPFATRARYVPDLSLDSATGGRDSFQDRPGVLFTDSVVRSVSSRLYRIATDRNADFCFMGVTPLRKRWKRSPVVSLRRAFSGMSTEILTLDRLQRYPLMVTGRFHAVMFAVQTKTPFVCIRSNTPKIESFLDEAGISDAPCLGHDEVTPNSVDRALADAKRYWTSDRWQRIDGFLEFARDAIDSMFREIREVSWNYPKQDDSE